MRLPGTDPNVVAGSADVAVVVAGASGRVQAEVQSGMRLGAQLLSDALDDLRQSPGPDRAYAALIADLPRVRHITFASGYEMGAKPPGLLARVLAPTPQAKSFPVTVGGRTLGVITIRSNPSDEIGEIRAELLTSVSLLIGVWVSTVALIRGAVTRGLRPLDLLGTAFDRLEHGQTGSIQPFRTPNCSASASNSIGFRRHSRARSRTTVTSSNG